MSRRLLAPATIVAAAAATAVTLAACGGTGSAAPTESTTGAGTTRTTITTSSSASTPAAPGTSASSPASAPASTSTSPSSSTATVVPDPTGYSTPTTVAPVGNGCVPARLSVRSVGIDGEPVVTMGTNAQGQIYPPPKTTMWYDKSAQLGTNGRTVIAGHVTYDGPDEFYDLDQVRVGAPIAITCTDGRSLTYTVTAKRSELKTRVTTDQQVWGGSSSPVLVLITCDKNSPIIGRHHLNNYLVWAEPRGA